MSVSSTATAASPGGTPRATATRRSRKIPGSASTSGRDRSGWATTARTPRICSTCVRSADRSIPPAATATTTKPILSTRETRPAPRRIAWSVFMTTTTGRAASGRRARRRRATWRGPCSTWRCVMTDAMPTPSTSRFPTNRAPRPAPSLFSPPCCNGIWRIRSARRNAAAIISSTRNTSATGILSSTVRNWSRKSSESFPNCRLSP